MEMLKCLHKQHMSCFYCILKSALVTGGAQMTQSVQLEVPVSVTRKPASAHVAQVSMELFVMSVRMDTGTWMGSLGASPATVTQNMLSITSVIRLILYLMLI